MNGLNEVYANVYRGLGNKELVKAVVVIHILNACILMAIRYISHNTIPSEIIIPTKAVEH